MCNRFLNVKQAEHSPSVAQKNYELLIRDHGHYESGRLRGPRCGSVISSEKVFKDIVPANTGRNLLEDTPLSHSTLF